MKVISFLNNKGGVGKTTSVINFGAILGALNKKVLLIDVDPQGNLQIGLKGKGGSKTIYDVLVDEASIQEVIFPSYLPNVDMIHSSFNLGSLHQISLDALKDNMSGLDYDYVLIDSPPALGSLMGMALYASDIVVIPLQCEYFALRGLVTLLNMIQKMEDSFGKKITNVRILPTMFDQRSKISKEILNKLTSLIPDKVIKFQIPRNIRVVESNSAGEPLILYDLNSHASMAYLNVAKELLSL